MKHRRRLAILCTVILFITFAGARSASAQSSGTQSGKIPYGNGGSISNFTSNLPYFSQKYKVIIADSRAQGKSADPGNSLSYEMMADDLSALLDQLHVDSANVIGGDHDVIKPAHTMLIADNIPHSYLWILPNSGHSTPVVYADQFNSTVDDFFKKPFREITKEKRFY